MAGDRGTNSRDELKSGAEHSEPKDNGSREEGLDETIEDSFPASDPPSTLPNPRVIEPSEPEHPDEKRNTQKGERAS